MTHEAASMAKAWTTLRGREVVALGRELLGGNGIVADFLVAKAFCDMEAYYTYEGACCRHPIIRWRTYCELPLQHRTCIWCPECTHANHLCPSESALRPCAAASVHRKGRATLLHVDAWAATVVQLVCMR